MSPESSFKHGFAMPLSHSFTGFSAVVTGSSSGIGQATANQLAQNGISGLAIHYCSNRSGAEATAAMARNAGCEKVVLIQADLSDASQRSRLVANAFEELGQVDIWINNAGADVLTGDAASWDFAAKLGQLWKIDVAGTIDLSRQVVPRLRAQTSTTPPSITFIGWDQAPHGMDGDAGQMFGPIKAAVMAYANSLAQDVAPEIRVNTVAPGWIQTSWGESSSEYWDDRAKSQSLMDRWGRPDDVAQAILHVADPTNTFTTGQTTNVNGGWNRRFSQS